MNPSLRPYEKLIEAFNQRKIDTAEFEEQYFSLFKADSIDWKDGEFEILDELFGSVDDFCPDPNLREEEETVQPFSGSLRNMDTLELRGARIGSR